MQIEITPAYLASQGLSEIIQTQFWERVDKNGPIPDHCKHLGPCWIWKGGVDNHGYGWLAKGYSRSGRGGETFKAHRLSWVLCVGPIPGEKPNVLHHCDNPPCVNPKHLWVGTKRDNSQDMKRKGRWATIAKIGEKNPIAKLTWEEVQEIRRLHTAEGLNTAQLGKMFEVHRSTIWCLLYRGAWKAKAELNYVHG